MTEIKKREEALALLSSDERDAYDKAIRLNKPGVGLTLNQRLFELFLRGMTCDAIVTLNPGLTLGQVVRARVEGHWDERQSKYVQDLLDTTSSVVQQSAAEAVNFLALVLAVAHREHGSKLQKYLATGDPECLGDFRIQNLGSYQKAIQTLGQLIGADQKKTVTHKVVGVDDSVKDTPEEQGGVLGGLGTGRLTPKQADALRAALEKTKE